MAQEYPENVLHTFRLGRAPALTLDRAGDQQSTALLPHCRPEYQGISGIWGIILVREEFFFIMEISGT